ncbi:MAG: asparagine synthase (glutamine-hydrolyzing) [Thaumarchaeota archaeon]|nr:asparagine synthase (glutamine-hydrolyzing) [Nitrososphaerota archaeon]
MCGINGFSWSDEVSILRMNQLILHRGPDDSGHFCDSAVSLGSDRLAIIDISKAGHQPMLYRKDEQELRIVYNGEIYNYRELKANLEQKGYSFRSNSDTEVILAAYLEWGDDCVDKLAGMWSFAIYDKQAQKIFLSRDRFGIKPLYYCFDGTHLIFSSEIKALLSHDVKREPNEKVMFDYLVYGLVDHGEDTFFLNIKRIMPANNAIYDLASKKLTIWKYYELDSCIYHEASKSSMSFYDMFLDSVRRHLSSDVPVGSCLSGGLDSSSIVCAMRQLIPKEEIKAFSLQFPGLEIDESEYQMAVSQKCEIDRFATSFTANDLLSDLEDLVATQEEPFQGLSVYGQYKVMQLAHQNGMKVLLDGQGSDEILGGYDYLSAFYFYELLRNMKFVTLFKELWKYSISSKGRIFELFFGLLLPSRAQSLIISRSKNYISPSFFMRNHRGIDKRFKRDFLDDALVKAVTYYPLPALLRYEDKNSMRWSIETRVPFVDHLIVQYCLGLPSDQKVRNGVTKFALRQAMKGLVPDVIIDRKDKIGFATPEFQLASSEEISKELEAIVTSELFKKRPYWNWEVVLKKYVLAHLSDNYPPMAQTMLELGSSFEEIRLSTFNQTSYRFCRRRTMEDNYR